MKTKAKDNGARSSNASVGDGKCEAPISEQNFA